MNKAQVAKRDLKIVRKSMVGSQTYISGSLVVMSATAAIGIPKLLAGPQKSSGRSAHVSRIASHPS